MLCLLHGATFLGLKSTAGVRGAAAGVATKLAWPAVTLVAVYAGWMLTLSDAGVWRILAAAVPVVAALAAALLIRSHHEGRSFAGPP